jgi:predicted RNase H-like HicB family nuclease
MPTAARFTIELDREADGRWIAEIRALPGVLAYGATRDEAVARTKALALRVLAERLEQGEPTGELDVLFEAA